MRIAFISDIHGDNTAFKAMLADIEQKQVDAIICLGDMATLGPQQNQTPEVLKKLGSVCIMGNHESD